MMIKSTLASRWAELAAEITAADTPKDMVEALRRCFYAGASAMVGQCTDAHAARRTMQELAAMREEMLAAVEKEAQP